jgi:hypothetical protein
MINGILEAIVSLEERMDRRFELVDQRFVALEQKMDRRFAAIDQKLSRYFLWLVGILLTTMVAVILKG